jgi:hypothetical protein
VELAPAAAPKPLRTASMSGGSVPPPTTPRAVQTAPGKAAPSAAGTRGRPPAGCLALLLACWPGLASQRTLEDPPPPRGLLLLQARDNSGSLPLPMCHPAGSVSSTAAVASILPRSWQPKSWRALTGTSTRGMSAAPPAPAASLAGSPPGSPGPSPTHSSRGSGGLACTRPAFVLRKARSPLHASFALLLVLLLASRPAAAWEAVPAAQTPPPPPRRRRQTRAITCS